jgi:hypothetical protein
MFCQNVISMRLHGAAPFWLTGLEGNKRYIVYVVNAFYVEVRYDAQENTVESIRAFSSTMPLEPYLSGIDISGAVSRLE